MRDTLYELLNKCADNNINDAEPFSAQEVNNIMKRFRNEISSGENKKIRKFKPGIAITIAVVIAACLGTTAYAAEKLGAFDKLKNETRTVENDAGEVFPIEKNDRIDYENIGSAAEVLAEPVQSENENVSLAVDSIYCDGQMLLVGITGSLLNDNANGCGYLHLYDFDLEINGEPYTFSDSERNNRYGYMTIDYGAENSFTGSIRCVFDAENKLTETADVKVNFGNIECSEKYFTDRTPVGSASVQFTVTPDASLTKQIGRLYENDGFTFTVHEVTPAMMTASFTYPDDYRYFRKDGSDDPENIVYVYDGNGNIVDKYPKYSIIAMVYDEYGNRLERVLDSPVVLDNGINAETFAAPPTNTIIVKFCNKQKSDENGMPVVMKEMTIDLTDAK